MENQLEQNNKTLESQIYGRFAEDTKTPNLLWALGATAVLIGAEVLDKIYDRYKKEEHYSHLDNLY